jgi:serine protein kinase
MSDFRDVHIAPHTLKVAAMFAVMSRMEESQKCDLLTKMKIYNGEEVIERGRVKKIDVKDLREEFEREGMKGISTRFIMKSIDAALSDSENDTITPISMLKALKNQVKDQITDIDFRNRCMDIIQKMVRDEYLKILENEIAKAFISAYEEQAKSIFDSYLDNAEAYTTSGTVRNKITKEERRPDERFMKSIESAIGISGSSKDGFRSDVTAYMFAKMRKGENVDYTTYAPLKDAIESYLISSVKDIARIVTKSKTRDDDQRKRYSEMMRVLIEDYGYNENSAEEVITYASNNIWRDS